MWKWIGLAAALLIAALAAIWIMDGNGQRDSSDIPNPVTGLVTAASEASVTIETDDGQSVTFVNQADNITVEHLIEHRDDLDPVAVTWHIENDDRIATAIDDVH
jgi:hypothetical protein